MPGTTLHTVLDGYFRENEIARGYVLDEQGHVRSLEMQRVRVEKDPATGRREVVPVSGQHGLTDFRLTMDVIFRY